MMTPDQIIAVVKAHADGATIQVRTCEDDSDWRDIEAPGWNFAFFNYRVKLKQPREWWLEVTRYTTFVHSAIPAGAYEDEDFAKRFVHVREVLPVEAA